MVPALIRRPLRWTGLAVLAAALAGCIAPHPEVTVYGNRTSVVVSATQWCSVDGTGVVTSCPAADTALRHILVPAGQPVLIEVPTQVADAPWQVLAKYTDDGKTLQVVKSEVFADHRLTFTLQPPTGGSALVYVEVQAYPGLVSINNGADQIAGFAHTWAVIIDPS